MSYNYYDSKDMTKENLTQDKEFVEDARIFLAERESYKTENSLDTQEGKEEIYDRFMEHFIVSRKKKRNHTKRQCNIFVC